MDTLFLRVAVVLVLAVLAGVWLGCVFVAMWNTGNRDAAMGMVSFGAPLIGFGMSLWATSGAVVQ